MPLAPVRVQRIAPSALYFDGVDDYVKVPKLTPDEWTVEVIIKPLSHDPTHDCIFMFGDYVTDSYVWWDHNVSPPGFSMQVVIGGTRYMTRLDWRPELGRWYVLHFARSLAGEQRIYVNGELEKTGKDPGGPVNHDANPSAIGGNIVRNLAYTNSVIALVRVYNRTLSEGEIRHNYFNINNPIRSGLILWLHWNSISENSWRDISGYNNHGTIYGAKKVSIIKPNVRALPALRVLASVR